MVNPMSLGLSPQVAAQAKEIGKVLGVRLIKERRSGRLTMEFIARDPRVDLGSVVDLMTENMATQLYTFFGVSGEIEEAE